MAKEGSEKDVQKSIIQYLKLKKVVAYRMNTGAIKTEGRFLRFGSPGMADVVAFTPQTVAWIEVKGPKGIQSDAQKDFQKVHEGLGHVYILARSLDDVRALFEEVKG